MRLEDLDAAPLADDPFAGLVKRPYSAPDLMDVPGCRMSRWERLARPWEARRRVTAEEWMERAEGFARAAAAHTIPEAQDRLGRYAVACRRRAEAEIRLRRERVEEVAPSLRASLALEVGRSAESVADRVYVEPGFK